eukprot:1878519-Pleurochrysis_carterae.AAC.2
MTRERHHACNNAPRNIPRAGARFRTHDADSHTRFCTGRVTICSKTERIRTVTKRFGKARDYDEGDSSETGLAGV